MPLILRTNLLSKPNGNKVAIVALSTAGLKKFGSRAEMAVTKELSQFNTYEVFGPLEASTLDEEEK
jgi:hypothetical protein